LLEQNIQHEKRILELEAELKSANENIAQLNHELFQKTELINILTDNEELASEHGNKSQEKINKNSAIIKLFLTF
jgi:trafficking kinesin-binding protein 1